MHTLIETGPWNVLMPNKLHGLYCQRSTLLGVEDFRWHVNVTVEIFDLHYIYLVLANDKKLSSFDLILTQDELYFCLPRSIAVI